MRYFKITDENANILAIGKNDNLGIEITEAEYKALLTEIRAKADLVNQLYAGEITLEEVPAEWQDEIQRRVEERKTWETSMVEEVE